MTATANARPSKEPINPRVLLVEDDPDLRPTLADMLTLEQFEVETAANGLLALQRLQSPGPCPDVILLDWLIPVMDGNELLLELDKDARLRTIPVVVLSGARDIERQLAGRRQVARTLTKPLSLQLLVDSLRRVIPPPDQTP